MIVFLHIPKTAGSTFQFILENSFGFSACHTNHTRRKIFSQGDFEFARKFFPRLRSLAGHNLIDPLQLSVPDAFYMTFVREPVARVISHYQDSVVLGTSRLTFEESLHRGGIFENLQVKLMAGTRDLGLAKRFLEKCAFVGLTEKFDLSLHVLGRIIPCKLNLNYQKRRIARDNTIRKTLENDSRMLEMAAEFNQLDIELYSFAIQEIFPKLCAKAGLTPSDNAPSFEKFTSDLKPKFLLSKFYNKAFRVACKLRRDNNAPATRD